MEIESNVDPARVIEEAFTGVFQPLFHKEDARKYLGFSNISAFSNENDLPGWYLWFEGIDGSFQIELAQADLISIRERGSERGPFSNTSAQGSCAIRYYPSEKEDTFETYSCYEQLIRLGPLFDSTGTPTPEGRRQIPKSYFIVGDINVRMSLSRDFLELECLATERWVDIRVDGLYLNAPDNKNYEAVSPGGRDRNVPGWMLTSFLFDKILSGFCYTFTVAPCVVFLSSKEAFTFYIDEKNRVDKRMNSDLKQFRLVCGLDLKEKWCSPFKEYKNIDLYTQSVKDRLQREEGDIKGIWKRPEDITTPDINPNWWKFKDMEFREGDTEISCYHDH